MTKEEAIIIIDSLNPGVIIKTSASNEKIKEAIKMALIALSQPSLPSNLDEAAEDYEAGIHFSLSVAFISGAEWMAGQGVTKEAVIGMATEEISINVSEQVLDELDLRPGDKVVVQIRKK